MFSFHTAGQQSESPAHKENVTHLHIFVKDKRKNRHLVKWQSEFGEKDAAKNEAY